MATIHCRKCCANLRYLIILQLFLHRHCNLTRQQGGRPHAPPASRIALRKLECFAGNSCMKWEAVSCAHWRALCSSLRERKLAGSSCGFGVSSARACSGGTAGRLRLVTVCRHSTLPLSIPLLSSRWCGENLVRSCTANVFKRYRCAAASI